MKKQSFILVAILVSTFVSCSLPTRLINTTTYKDINIAQPTTALFADLEVSPKKISFSFIPSKTILNGGVENVINTAVREALLANGNADVLVALETQIKYNNKGQIESITVTGYPAKYVNFRSPGDDYLREISKSQAFKENSSSITPHIGKIKFDK